ncbi:MAG TPA: hypothetical protein VMR16_02385 [Candidatus Saccharimonadales bacterium]|nr:hypothetical protein [Candidatus Saccharimonadales bacterium]
MKLYSVGLYEQALINKSILKDLNVKRLINRVDPRWGDFIKVDLSLRQIREIQNVLIKHYDDASIPWYLVGSDLNDKKELIVAFGADDGDGGRLFQFRKDDIDKYSEVVRYGIAKGIPESVINFLKLQCKLT